MIRSCGILGGVTDVRRILRIQARHNLVEHAVFQSVQLVPVEWTPKIFPSMVIGATGADKHRRRDSTAARTTPPSQVHQGYPERPTRSPTVKADIAPPTRFNGSNSGRSPLRRVPRC